MVGLAISVVILAVLRSAAAQVGARLMDAVDPALVEQAAAVLGSVTGVREVRELRLRWLGHTLRAEADVTVDPDLSLRQAHDVAHRAEHDLVHAVARLAAVTVHASPAGAHR